MSPPQSARAGPEPTEEIRVTSWTHLLDVLYADGWNSSLRRHRSPYVFRGSHNASFTLQTSLQRLGGDPAETERHLLRNFRKYAHQESVRGDTVWDWLALGQHHGLPTRLVDFTYSPLVALHFATRMPSQFTHDGAIWRVNPARVHGRLPTPLRDALADEGSQVFTVEMLQSVMSLRGTAASFSAAPLSELAALSDTPFLTFLEPPSLDARIIQQFALFALPSTPELQVEAWLEAQPHAALKITIPADLKWQIRDHLDQANITERTLFPGLAGLAHWLTLYYTTPPLPPESGGAQDLRQQEQNLREMEAENGPLDLSRSGS
ncbi:FRG domain-containing protein [Deinococcus sp. QL22]|uniref:FRG domain-containing protein n=1 Tax=Deinococcus sp. QL22 TaxID=2939437 RepID=UPI002017D23C|nr:FRG domain-containing protein [Deinococcus sp. QL22]UQN09716.1 FRG domain-containing protein [Deinococcus sp. QL22]